MEGRTDLWFKSKCLQSTEFIVVGYTDPTSSRLGFGALVLGFWNEQKQLCYAGRVGTGFSHDTLVSLKKQLAAMKQKQCPLEVMPDNKEKGTHWVEPQLVVEVEYGGWTNDGLVRFPSYRGLRDDVDIKNVTHEAIQRAADPDGAESRGRPRRHVDACKQAVAITSIKNG